MTGNDLIVAAPWIIFGAGLSAVWIRLLRARHASRHRPGRSRLPFPGPGRLRRSRAQAPRPGDVPAARRRAGAEHSLQRFGMQIIMFCRFIPGGRTAVTLSCGLIGYPRRRFITATAAAGIIWALYSFFIGRLGGKAFEGNPWAGFLIAFAAAIVVSGLIEAARRIRSRWPRTTGRDGVSGPGHRTPPYAPRRPLASRS